MGSAYKAVAVYPAPSGEGPRWRVHRARRSRVRRFRQQPPGGPGHLTLLSAGPRARRLAELDPAARRNILLGPLRHHISSMYRARRLARKVLASRCIRRRWLLSSPHPGNVRGHPRRHHHRPAVCTGRAPRLPLTMPATSRGHRIRPACRPRNRRRIGPIVRCAMQPQQPREALRSLKLARPRCALMAT